MFYKICRYFFYAIIVCFWGIKINGKRKLNQKEPLIIAANHISYLDPIALGVAYDREIHFFAKKEVFDVPILGLIVRWLKAIPVDREKTNANSIKKSIKVLKKGFVLGVFPEGTRSANGELLEFSMGMIKIALKTSTPILPVGINGTFEAYPPKSKFPKIFKRRPIYINFGKPIYLDSSMQKDIKYQKECLVRIKKEIKRLSSVN